MRSTIFGALVLSALVLAGCDEPRPASCTLLSLCCLSGSAGDACRAVVARNDGAACTAADPLYCGSDAGMPPGDDGGTAGAELVGSWGNTRCVWPEAIDCDTTFTYEADGTYAMAMTYTKDPATTTGFAGCQIAMSVTGYTWTATATTVSVSAGSSAAMTITRSGCDDPADNSDTMPSPDFTPSSFEHPAIPWMVSGDTLTLAGMDHTRR